MAEEMIEGYKVTVFGQYHAASGKERFLKTYKNEEFFIPKEVHLTIGRRAEEKVINGVKTKKWIPVKEKSDGLKAALHVIMRQFLPVRLSEKYPDFLAVRRCRISRSVRATVPASEVESLSPTDVSKMSLSQLERYCAANEIPVPVRSFPKLEDAREAVLDELEARKTEAQAASNTEEVSAAPTFDEDDEESIFV